MKGISLLTAAFLLFTALASADVSLNGYLQTDTRFRVQGEREFTWNRSEIDLKLEGSPSEKLHLFGETSIRGLGFPSVMTLADLQRFERDRATPWSIDLKEAYLDVYSFLIDNLDLRIGKQIVVWGTADRINPTSNICPDDLEDVFDFGEKLGVNSIKASLYWSVGETDLTLTGVFVPVFTPSILPPPEWTAGLMENQGINPPQGMSLGMTLGEVKQEVKLPENKLGETSSFGLRFLANNLKGYDISVSYYRGRDKLPIQSSLTLWPHSQSAELVQPPASSMPPQGPMVMDGKLEMIYPKIQVIGADMAGELPKVRVGTWAECALFIPEKVDMITNISTPLGQMSQTTTVLEDKPYLKFVVGWDYTFKDGTYVNFQYLHGFPFERGRDNLNDYFAFRLERKFLNDELKVTPIGFSIGIDDWSDVGENYGMVFTPEVSYSPQDNIELKLGAYLLHGEGKGFFSSIKDKDEIYLKAKMSF